MLSPIILFLALVSRNDDLLGPYCFLASICITFNFMTAGIFSVQILKLLVRKFDTYLLLFSVASFQFFLWQIFERTIDSVALSSGFVTLASFVFNDAAPYSLSQRKIAYYFFLAFDLVLISLLVALWQKSVFRINSETSLDILGTKINCLQSASFGILTLVLYFGK